MIKNKIFKQGIGIAEKSLETRRDHWGGNVNYKSLFDSIKMFMDHFTDHQVSNMDHFTDH